MKCSENHKFSKFCLCQIIMAAFSILFIFSLTMSPIFSRALTGQQNTTASVERKYENTGFGIRMHYPANWAKVQDNSTSKKTCSGGLCLNATFLTLNFISPPPASGIFGITVMASSNPLSYNDWLSSTLPHLKKAIEGMGGRIVESNEGNVTGMGGYKMTFTQKGIIHTDWTIVANGKLYTIGYSIPENNTTLLPTFQNVINSIAILKTTSNQTSTTETIKNELG
jgi:hypothetical protein